MSEFYNIIIIFMFLTGCIISILMFFTNKLKVDIKNTGILFLLFAVGIYLKVKTDNYIVQPIDYILLSFLVLYCISNIIEKFYIHNKNEEIFEEERKWKEKMFKK